MNKDAKTLALADEIERVTEDWAKDTLLLEERAVKHGNEKQEWFDKEDEAIAAWNRRTENGKV